MHRQPIWTTWIRSYGLIALLTILLYGIGPFGAKALAHGGKTHGEAFTALQALQKATGLYDKLLASGKLDASWETGLASVEIVSRGANEVREYRIGFHRSSGDPQAVYIFLSADGEYSGSNFDGKW